jgi:hypothetical protein
VRLGLCVSVGFPRCRHQFEFQIACQFLDKTTFNNRHPAGLTFQGGFDVVVVNLAHERVTGKADQPFGLGNGTPELLGITVVVNERVTLDRRKDQDDEVVNAGRKT